MKAGVNDPDGYYGFASAFVKANDDDLLDLLVVNDSTPKQLYINKGNGTFQEVGYPSGIALNENGREQAGMGLAIGDYDHSGGWSIFARASIGGGEGRFSRISVLMSPGKIEQARMPLARSSTFSNWVKPARPNFDAA